MDTICTYTCISTCISTRTCTCAWHAWPRVSLVACALWKCAAIARTARASNHSLRYSKTPELPIELGLGSCSWSSIRIRFLCSASGSGIFRFPVRCGGARPVSGVGRARAGFRLDRPCSVFYPTSSRAGSRSRLCVGVVAASRVEHVNVKFDPKRNV